jgi:hypothetical protein
MAKFNVCPECEGEGYLGTLGAFTPGEFWEQFDDAQEYLEMHEASKAPCDYCKGMRVVNDERLAEYEDYLEYQAERAMEQRYGC